MKANGARTMAPAALLCMAACGGAGTTTVVPHAPAASLEQWSVSLGPEAYRLAPVCSALEADHCDGIDNNCDGRIDEGCVTHAGGAYAPPTDDVQVVITWNSGADLDLVIAAGGDHLRPAASGSGALEAVTAEQGEGSCGSPTDRARARMERAHIPRDALLHRREGVSLRVHMARGCDAPAETMATVSLSVPEQPTISFNLAIAEGAAPMLAASLLPPADADDVR